MEETTIPQVSVSTVSLPLLEPALPVVATPNISLQGPKDTAQRCTICNSTLNQIRLDGIMEKASILPCSHIFGDICIQRWLETDSLHHDCPICRRPMLYRACGHIIRACGVEEAPKGVKEEDMPENCVRCRSNRDGGSGADGGLRDELRQELRQSREMLLAQERALEGTRRLLPGVFGGMCRSTVQSVDARIEELRREWGGEADAAFRKLEEKEGMREW